MFFSTYKAWGLDTLLVVWHLVLDIRAGSRIQSWEFIDKHCHAFRNANGNRTYFYWNWMGCNLLRKFSTSVCHDFCGNWIQKYRCESCRPYGHTILNFSTSLDLFTFLRLVVTVHKGRTIPVQALRVPGSWGSQISRQSAHEDGKIVIPTPRPALPHRKYSWYTFLSKVVSTSWP